jgi:hypothetical protein
MQLSQVAIPQYSQKTGKGNYNPGRGGVSVDTIVIHWMDGNMADADKVFTNASTVHSAHFGVEDGNVHQYVRLADTAFHAGIYSVNQRSVGIEHSADPTRPASDATYETSSQLVVQVCRQLGHPVSFFQFKRHGDIIATQCCGSVDVGRIRDRALEIEAAAVTPTVTVASVQVPVTTDFWVRLSVRAHVRDEADTESGIYDTYDAGSEIECDGQVTGEKVGSTTTWYHTKDHQKYVSASVCSIISKPSKPV